MTEPKLAITALLSIVYVAVWLSLRVPSAPQSRDPSAAEARPKPASTPEARRQTRSVRTRTS